VIAERPDDAEIRRRIVDLLRSPGYHPATTRGLLKRLGLPREVVPSVQRAVRDLAREGTIAQSGGRWLADLGDRDRIVGRFLRHPEGYGFVRSDREEEEDVFLAADRAAGLMHGDRVEVRVLRRDRRGRVEGRLERVVAPAPRRVTGVIEIRGREARVFPYEERIARFIRIRDGGTGGAADRMAVGVRVDVPPDDDGIAVGEVVEALGYPDEPGTDIEIIIRRFDLRHEWPAEVAAEVEVLPDVVSREDLEGREDFSGLPTVTIDGETAKDFDDAISIRRRREGGWRLWVHVADVAHYVREGSAIDREALARGTSVYFPGRAVPMLPEKLSNDLCSLRPGVPRLVRTALLDLDRDGRVEAARFAEGWIRSAERMTYTAVAGILVRGEPALLERYAPLVDEFREMEAACRALHARRRQRGSLDFDLPEPEIVLDARGEMTGVFPAERTIAHRMIEEFMLAANEAVATRLLERRAPALYRVHEEPSPARLEALDEVLQGLGHRLPRPLDAIEPAHLGQILDGVKGRPEERFVSRLVLRSMQLARYDPRNLGHFGLAAERYTHFTSPIRRYPDLVVHRALRDAEAGSLDPDGVEAGRRRAVLPEVAARCSETERVAEDAERELEEWKKLDFMADRVGEEYAGFVSAVMPFGLFVELEEFYVEGLVHISTLGERCRYEERGHRMVGQTSGRAWRLGDRVNVRVVRVDRFFKRMDLEIPGLERQLSRRARDRRRRRGT
jgi:ribonuclease R